ncbi:MAG: serine/threonine-protein kinase [Bryobacteraceae bacterium]
MDSPPRLANYQVLEKAGQGGMGVVYKARDTRLDRLVAIKALPSDRVADPERKRRFIQEARAASALQHPNIVTIYDLLTENDGDFLVMEFVEGKTLAELIPRGGMDLDDAIRYAAQIADALARAHAAGIVHRDLKPGNVIVTAEGRVKLLDFGLAKLTAPEPPQAGSDATLTAIAPRTEEGVIVGTACPSPATACSLASRKPTRISGSATLRSGNKGT